MSLELDGWSPLVKSEINREIEQVLASVDFFSNFEAGADGRGPDSVYWLRGDGLSFTLGWELKTSGLYYELSDVNLTARVERLESFLASILERHGLHQPGGDEQSFLAPLVPQELHAAEFRSPAAMKWILEQLRLYLEETLRPFCLQSMTSPVGMLTHVGHTPDEIVSKEVGRGWVIGDYPTVVFKGITIASWAGALDHAASLAKGLETWLAEDRARSDADLAACARNEAAFAELRAALAE